MQQTAVAFSSREKAKIARVFRMLEARLNRRLKRYDTRYDNEMGCGNCGDTGPVYKTLSSLSRAFGIESKGRVGR